MSTHTKGPWYFEADKGLAGHWTVWADIDGVKTFICDCYQGDDAKTDARLIAAAPPMADAIKGLIGLCQLLRNRDDCPSEIRQALTYNHRIIAGYEALSAAGIDGFQPSDFDAAKSTAKIDARTQQ